MITITLNGRRRELDGPKTVAALVDSMGLAPRQVAVALNGEVVPRGDWAATEIADGDTVEIVRAVGGG